jgi:hypothetical protein
LDVSENQITSLEGFPYISSLKHLKINNNYLTSFEYFSNVEHLTHIELQNNQIESFEHLSDLPNIIFLWLQNNAIESFQYFPDAPNLYEIHLENNRIYSFQYLPTLPSLRNFYLENNNISSFKYAIFPQIQILSVDNNPITSFEYFPNVFPLYVFCMENVPIISYKGISLNSFKRSSICKSRYEDMTDDFIECFISRDLEEHQDAIIKNENENEISAAKSFIYFYSLHVTSIELLMFAIQYDIKIHISFNILFENREYIEKWCKKHDTSFSRSIMYKIQDRSKKTMHNGDIVCF